MRSLHRERGAPLRWFRFGLALLVVAWAGAALPNLRAADEPTERTVDEVEDQTADVTKLAAYNVKADRVETFGFGVWHRLRNPFSGSVTIVSVIPNTAAARAGLRPGDRILKSDGKATNFSLFSIGRWRRFQQAKWAQVAAGRPSVTWELVVQSPGDAAPRVARLVIPTPAPHWGSSKWQPPLDRKPTLVSEPGPLADLTRTVFDNGIWQLGDGGWLGLKGSKAIPIHRGGLPPLGYGWQLRVEACTHTIWVTQERGRTDIVLSSSSPTAGWTQFLTSPSGALEKARGRHPHGPMQNLEVDEARPAFAAELDFWLNKVGKVTARWPLEVKPAAYAAGTYLIVRGDPSAKEPPPDRAANRATATGKLAAEVLKLPLATEAQRQLFADAYGKIGADSDQWAYTQAYHTLESKRRFVMRVDPSQPEGQQCTLVTVDGKPPQPADLKAWRDAGQDSPTLFGDLPPLDQIVDVRDLRIFADEPAALVFELPIRGGNAQFSGDRFQALFRVNKTQRAFEDIRVKLRDSIRIAGVVKIAEAGITLRFATLDPKLAPQPVELKAGGTVSVLLIRASRSFEATRTDFRRVSPKTGVTTE